MRSIYYKKLGKIYVFLLLNGKKEGYYYGNEAVFAIPLSEYFTYMRLGVNNKYA